jgi:hypothetical protein
MFLHPNACSEARYLWPGRAMLFAREDITAPILWCQCFIINCNLWCSQVGLLDNSLQLVGIVVRTINVLGKNVRCRTGDEFAMSACLVGHINRDRLNSGTVGPNCGTMGPCRVTLYVTLRVWHSISQEQNDESLPSFLGVILKLLSIISQNLTVLSQKLTELLAF